MRTRLNSIGVTGFSSIYGLCVLTSACVGGSGSGEPEAEEPVGQLAAPLTSDELKGEVLGDGFGDSNRCVDDVVAAFNALPGSPSNRAKYVSKGGQRLPPYNARLEPFSPLQFEWTPRGYHPDIPHIEGVSRFEFGDEADDRWLAVSRAYDQTGKAGIFLVHLSDMDGTDGGQLLDPGVDYTSPIPADRATQYYYPTQGGNHPGGMQAFGRYLAVAVEPKDGFSWVDFYDFSAGFGAGDQIQRLMMFPRGRDFTPGRSIGGVAVTRLKDRRYFMFVLGKDDDRDGWFFVSADTKLPSAWYSVDHFQGGDTIPPPPVGGFRNYQNVTMLTDCSTANIYLLATGNSGFAGSFADGEDFADLFQLVPSSVGMSMVLAARRDFSPGTGGYCTFRAAATAYAGKDNKLYMYCHAHHSNSGLFSIDPTLKFVEYASTQCLHVTCGSECCAEGESCVDGACCASGNTCGASCCGGGSLCKDASIGLCCQEFEQACGNACCGIDQACVDGSCQDVPPPPPPPPGDCGVFPSCSSFESCGPGFYCNDGGCCTVLR